MSIRIEVLFPEFANLFGDCWNVRYLKQCMPEAEFIETPCSEEPRFVREDVQMVYMGAMTERQQELVIETLRPYRDRLQEMIDKGVLFLMTANAGEVFCDYIENEDGSRVEGLGLVHLHSTRDMMHRFHGMALAECEGMKLVCFKTEFAQIQGDNSAFPLAKLLRGCGMNKTSAYEGIRINNFMITSSVGPFLVMNPLFVKYIQTLLGAEPKLAFEDEIMGAYAQRLGEFESDKIKY